MWRCRRWESYPPGWTGGCPPWTLVIRDLEAQKHRRSVKTHIPLDGLPYFPQVKYVVVSRDARDVFMSLWNHYSNYTDLFYQMLNETPGRVGNPLPRCPNEARQLWHMWITTGWFEWDSEGFPFWSNMRHVQTWWSYRHLPNILFVHFKRPAERPPGRGVEDRPIP